MAYTKKSADATKTSTQVVDDTTVTVNETIINETAPTIRKFEQEDLIPCRSMVSGQLFIEGTRSKLLYTFADYNDVCDIEYRDLIYMVRTYNNRFVYEPWIIIEDEDFELQKTLLVSYSVFSIVDVGDALISSGATVPGVIVPNIDTFLSINYPGLIKVGQESVSVFLSYLHRWTDSPEKIVKKIEKITLDSEQSNY